MQSFSLKERFEKAKRVWTIANLLVRDYQSLDIDQTHLDCEPYQPGDIVDVKAPH